MTNPFKENLRRTLQNLIIFVRFVAHNFGKDGCSYRAGALAFASLLAIVPLMTIGLTIFSTFPIFQSLKAPLQNFIFVNFVPATGQVIEIYLEHFVQQVSNLSLLGVIFLLFTAILVMFTIERAMNTIWRVEIHRKNLSAILLYWAILSLTPLFLGLTLAASSYLTSLPILFNHQISPFLFNVAPYLLSFVGFTFLYVVVPNYPVQLIHGMGGAVISTFLFESAKQSFAYYLANYNFYALLYGAFATIPIFFIWIYWVWIITLLGAEVSYAMSVNLKQYNGKKSLPGFVHALLWLYQLWNAQQLGQGLSLKTLINSSNQPYEIDPQKMIEHLSQEKIIHLTSNNEYRLSKNIGTMSLYQLTTHLPYRLPIQSDLQNLQLSPIEQWKHVFDMQQKELESLLCISMEQLFRNHTNTI